jgi:hypothetical protein
MSWAWLAPGLRTRDGEGRWRSLGFASPSLSPIQPVWPRHGDAYGQIDAEDAQRFWSGTNRPAPPWRRYLTGSSKIKWKQQGSEGGGPCRACPWGWRCGGGWRPSPPPSGSHSAGHRRQKCFSTNHSRIQSIRLKKYRLAWFSFVYFEKIQSICRATSAVALKLSLKTS